MSKIEWTGETWNPVTGCTKISQGCKHCYAETMANRLKAMGARGYENGFKLTVQGQDAFDKPLKRKKPTTYFVCSMSDLFQDGVTFETIDCVMDVIEQCPQHTFQILTKRPERMAVYFNEFYGYGAEIPKNVWLGVTVENQEAANERIPHLLSIDAPVRFLSCEPLLEKVELKNWVNPYFKDGIHWIIVGGESGHNARPMHPDWARSIRDQCSAAGVPFFFKQWGEWGIVDCPEMYASQHNYASMSVIRVEIPSNFIMQTYTTCSTARLSEIEKHEAWCFDKNDLSKNPMLMRKIGKKKAGRLLDGVLHDAMPEVKHD